MLPGEIEPLPGRDGGDGTALANAACHRSDAISQIKFDEAAPLRTPLQQRILRSSARLSKRIVHLGGAFKVRQSEHRVHRFVAIDDQHRDKKPPFELPCYGNPREQFLVVIEIFIGAEPALRCACIPVKIRIFRFDKLPRQTSAAGAPNSTSSPATSRSNTRVSPTLIAD